MDSRLIFDWDAANRGHIARHRVSPEVAEQVIEIDPLDIEAETADGEERMISAGRTNQGKFLVVVTALPETGIRVVTAFPAPRRLVELYLTGRKREAHGEKPQNPSIRKRSR